MELLSKEIKCIECNSSGKYVEYNTHLEDTSSDCEQQPVLCFDSYIDCNNAGKQHFNLQSTITGQNCKNTVMAKKTRTLLEHARSNIETHQLVNNHLEPTIMKVENYYQAQNIDVNASDLVSVTSKFSKDKLENILNSYIEIKIKAEKLSKQMEDIKSKVKKLKEEIDNFRKSSTFTQETIMNLEERLAKENVNYNGTVVWKITNIRDKIQKAKSGVQSSCFSPPFYTHQNGFKACGRIYLNGDGIGINTHVSLFFVIMKGKYDCLLRWPFRKKVTFIMLDQSNNENKENVIDAFSPNPKSKSFEKPNSDMNIANGIPLFCPLIKLNSEKYLKDDAMLIKIITDSRDLIETKNPTIEKTSNYAALFDDDVSINDHNHYKESNFPQEIFQ